MDVEQKDIISIIVSMTLFWGNLIFIYFYIKKKKKKIKSMIINLEQQNAD